MKLGLFMMPVHDCTRDYHTTLMEDIDASATTGWNGGRGFDPIGSSTKPFTGILNDKLRGFYRSTYEDEQLVGQEVVRLRVEESTTEILLNAADLEILSATIDDE